MMEVVDSTNGAESAVFRMINNWFNGSQQLIISAKERLLGEQWWIPSDDREIAAIPRSSLKKMIRLKEHNLFFIHRSDYSSGVYYHVTMKWQGADRLSIVRAKTMEETIHDFNGLVVFSEIFNFVGSVRDLKNVVDLIHSHPGWQPVHIAAKLGLIPFFENAKLEGNSKKFLCLTSQPEQQYAMHICIENNQFELVKFLLTTGDFDLSTADAKGQNALHYSANSSFQMVQILCENEEAKNCMNALNNDGYTPLFMSIINCKPVCTTALLKQGAIFNVLCHGRSALHEAMLQNNSKVKDVIKTLIEASPDAASMIEPITGNAAWHLATNKTSLNAFLELCHEKVDLNTLNKAGRTALHCHTFRNDLGCVLNLATYGADLDSLDADGNTPLHIAVYNGFVDIVKALLVLGANVNILNAYGYSCRHLAGRSKSSAKEKIMHCLLIYKAKRCDDDVIGCSNWCVHLNSEDSSEDCESLVAKETHPIADRMKHTAYDEFLQKKCIDAVKQKCLRGEKLQVVLCLDGGGIRGLILVMILKFIEEELGSPIFGHINWLAGTSTGAFLASSLALGRSLARCQHMYLKFKDQLFEGWTRPYNSEKLERLLKTIYGETTMSEVQNLKLMVMATVADKQPVKLHIFRSYEIPFNTEEKIRFGYTDPKEVTIWKALRCSSAAPTYFAVVDKKYVDGGLMANNPTTEVLTEIHRINAYNEMNKNDRDVVKIGCVISIGTGGIPDLSIDSLNVSTSSPVESMSALRNLSVILVDQVTATEGLPVERARAWCHETSIPYFRFSTPLSKEYFLDTKDDKENVQMMWETAEYMCQCKEDVKLLVELLQLLKNPVLP